MTNLVSINEGIVEFSTLAQQQFNAPKKLGGLAFRLVLRSILKWSKPLLVAFVAELIRKSSEGSNLDEFVEDLIHELDKDGDGHIDR